MLNSIRKLIPSKKWCIALGTGGLIGSAIGYDRYARADVMRVHKQMASVVANERLSPQDKVRKVHIFIYKTQWAKKWFENYVKPIFDAAALDYEIYVIEEGEIRAKVKDHILSGWKDYCTDPQKAWKKAPFTISDITQIKYDPEEGFVAVGNNLLREIINGMEDFHYHITHVDPKNPHLENNFPYPPFGLVNFTDLSGWRNFPKRIQAQFISRYTSKVSGFETLNICLGKSRKIEEKDLASLSVDPSQPVKVSGNLLDKFTIYT